MIGDAQGGQPGTAELGGKPILGAEMSTTGEPKLVPELGTQGIKHTQELATEQRHLPELAGADMVGYGGQSHGNTVPELHGTSMPGPQQYSYPAHVAEVGADPNHK